MLTGFVRSGRVNSNNAKPLGNSGQNGYYWSSAPNPGGNGAYDLVFNGSDVYPSDNYRRYYGFPLRCLAS